MTRLWRSFGCRTDVNTVQFCICYLSFVNIFMMNPVQPHRGFKSVLF